MHKFIYAVLGVALLFLVTACGEDTPPLYLWDKVAVGMDRDEVLETYKGEVTGTFDSSILLTPRSFGGAHLRVNIALNADGKVKGVLLQIPPDNDQSPSLGRQADTLLNYMAATYGQDATETSRTGLAGEKYATIIWENAGLIIKLEV